MPAPPKNPNKYPGYPKPGQRSGNPMHRGGYVPPPRGGGGAGGGGFNMNKWLQQQAQKIVDARVAAIQQSQQIYLDELNRQAQERVRQGQALAAWMQGQNFPGRIQDIYRTAGSDITGYASGFGGEIKGIAEADAAQVNNMLSGTGQEARNEGQGMADVFYGAYGWSPARKFAETGAAFGADAAMQPSFAARFAQEDAYKIQQEGLVALKDFALQMAEARMGKSDIISDLRKQQEEAKEARFNRFLKLAALEMQRGNYKRANEYLKMAGQRGELSARKQRIAELKSQGYAPDGKTPLPGFHIDPVTGRPIENGWHVNPKTGLPVKNKDSKDKKPGADWGKIQQNMANEDLTVEAPEIIMGIPTGKTIKVPMTYEQAKARLLAEYGGYVKDKKRLLALIKQILAAKGIYPQAGGK